MIRIFSFVLIRRKIKCPSSISMEVCHEICELFNILQGSTCSAQLYAKHLPSKLNGHKGRHFKGTDAKFVQQIESVHTVCVGQSCVVRSGTDVSYLLYQDLIALIPTIIPFVDQTTLYGYLTANCIMSVNGLLSTCGTALCASMYILLIYNFTMQMELVGDDIFKLDQM